MRRFMLAPVLLAVALTSGCAVNGKWSLAKVQPETERRNFEFASLTLQKDGSFYAESQEPRVRSLSGTYTYEDGTLILVPHEGPRIAYDATMPDNNRLELTKTAQGVKVKTEFKRIE